ncbi:unnamed protein product [Nyctereutes procyonoides]|uniref:Peptidyl-prolyl cis-trans isomerase n=1 Tax=Nyctereutes procyonoides TaxID=34880 RepID=A0A811YVX8_NYCPR|nr:unnamed protein product [Nyctereutes procyonoides]
MCHPAMVSPTTFFDITVDREPLSCITFELFTDQVPKTAENFPAVGSCFHRIILGLMCQGGDFTRHDTCGKSTYEEKLADENFILKHMGPGILSVANAGPNTNDSQFFICTAKTVRESMNIMETMEQFGSRSDKPSRKIPIADCR